MKLASLIVAGTVAFAGTAAFAQNNVDKPGSAREAASDVGQSVKRMGQDAKQAGHTVTDAAKRGWSKARNMAHRGKDNVEAKMDKHDARSSDRQASRDMKRDDTRAMGASRDDRMAAGDGSRQQRMDDAYATWKSRHGDQAK